MHALDQTRTRRAKKTTSFKLAAVYRAVPDWSALAGLSDVAAIATAAEALLDAEVFSSATVYDALNRPTSMTAPDSSEIRPTYNEAGLLEKVEARVRGAATWTTFVDDIDYDAKGQREKIVYGNGTTTTYAYDLETFRLVRLKTVRDSDDAVLQNLAYAYDPVGNITEIKDSAQQTVFFDNDVVSPRTQYVYDALYRLIKATGREHSGGVADAPRDQNDVPLMNLPHANDSAALRNYVEQYVYDAVGNILTMSHDSGASATSWTRRYEIAAASNRLLSTSLPGDYPAATSYSATYAYDEHGSMTSMPHLPGMEWDHNDQMRQVDLGGGGTAYYTYDAAGQRVRKVWEHSGLVEERIYLGGWELYRKRDSLRNLLVERETLHGMDGARRVVLVETKTVDVGAGGAFAVVSRYRFQLDNHLGSASLEVDETGLVIGYEEYHPYGTTAYASGRSGVEVSGKRYRYTGKERDEETGLYYHGARHMAPWLGRWTSADPAGMVDGPSLYRYVRNNPVLLRDPTGYLSWRDALDNFVNNSAAAGMADAIEQHAEGIKESVKQLRSDLSSFKTAAPALGKLVGTAALGAPLAVLSMARHGVNASKAAYHLNGRGMVTEFTHMSIELVETVITVGVAKGIQGKLAPHVPKGALFTKVLPKAENAAPLQILEAPPTAELPPTSPQRSPPAAEPPPASPRPATPAAKPAQRAAGSVAAEHAVDEHLRSQGHRVEPNSKEGVQGAGRQGDRLVDGVLSEYKSISGVKDTSPDGLSKAVGRRVMDGRGQASTVIVDARGQTGMTQEIAERGIRRAYGADKVTAGSASRGQLQSIRVIGSGFDITVPWR